MLLSLGQRLKQAREERNLTVQTVEQTIRIRAIILEALETDDYSSISSAAQARGFLRNYCEYLEIDLDDALRELHSARPVQDEISGPMPQLSGDLPPQVISAADENPPQPLADAGIAVSQAESTLEVVSTDTPIVDIEKPTRGRKRKVETLEATEADTTADVKPKGGRRKKEVAAEEVIPVYAEPVHPARPEVIEPESVPHESTLPEIDGIQLPTETLSVMEDQLPVQDEARPTLLEKLKSLVKIKAPDQKVVEGVSSIKKQEIVVEEARPPKTPEEIFAEIGRQLRARREMLSLTLEEVELHTRVRAGFLQALEEGNFDKLPSAVQLRGMLSNYATFLDLDADTLLLRFADALQLRHRIKYPDRPTGSKPPMPVASRLPPLRSFMAGDLIFGSLIVAVLFGLAIWGIGRVIAMQEDAQVIPTAFFSQKLFSSSDETNTPEAVTEPPLPGNTLPVADTPATVEIPLQPANLQMVILAAERTFMRITVDGQVKFDGRAAPGSSYRFDAQNTIEVLTGNAAALHISFNGRDQGLLGGFGEVVSRIYTLGGVVTPTATSSPTPTNTPAVTPTPEIIDTPTPTGTSEG